MKSIFIVFFAVLMTLFSSGCTKHKKQTQKELEVISTGELQFNLTFPQFLWAKILDGAPPTINKSLGPYEIFFPLETRIEIVENKGSPLGGKNYRYEYSIFGGEIDWNVLLEKDQGGSVDLMFNFPGVEEFENFKVYFLSWSEKKIIHDEVFGNSCNRVLDITDFFKKNMYFDGLKLHTKDLRYLYATAGRFYFVNYGKEKIYLSQVSFNHSQLAKEGYLCGERI